jgi:succinate dehydrogenase/fumarate reductase flavoprotein subunit
MTQIVVVVGGGLAGLTAALEASQSSQVKQVLLLEKERIGGNSMRATSGINGLSRLPDSRDGPDQFARDIAESSRGSRGDDNGDYCPELIETLVKASPQALDWLEAQGIRLDRPRLLGGHTEPRTHRVIDPVTSRPLHVGSTLVRQLKERCLQQSKISLCESCRVTGLLWNRGRVTGVAYQHRGETVRQPANRVILTTGGFSSNLVDYIGDSHPEYRSLGTTNGRFAQGDGLKLATSLGAATVGMSHVQLHPTGLVNPKQMDQGEQVLGPEILRSLGGVLVNQQGSRFTDELGRRDQVVSDIFHHGNQALKRGKPIAYLIVNGKIAETFGMDLFEFYLKQGLFRKCDSIQALAQAIGDGGLAGNLVNSLHQRLEPPFYLAMVSPVIHYTMGGLKINKRAQVLDSRDRPIEGLYAAGEVTGGIHGRNRLAGNSLLECVVFGRIGGNLGSPQTPTSGGT